MFFKEKRNLIILTIACIALLLVFVFLSPPFGIKEKNTIFPGQIKPDMKFTRMVYYFVQKDAKWTIKAKSAQLFQAQGRLLLNGIKAEVVSKNSNPVEIVANKGTYYLKSGRLHLQGHVVITTAQGDRLTTSALDYYSRQCMISTEQPVNIKGNGLELNGIGMKYYLNTGRLEVENQHSTIHNNTVNNNAETH